MAKADDKATPHYFTLPQAAARIGWDKLEFLLIEDRLSAYQRQNWTRFGELNYDCQRGVLGASRDDLDAVSAAASGKEPFPSQALRRWVTERSVDRKTGEVIRYFDDYGRRIPVVFQPVVRSEDVLAHVPTQTITTAHQAVAKTSTVGWVAAEARRLKTANKIPNDIRITEFAKLLEEQMVKAVKAGRLRKAVGWRHIKHMLPDWGCWPVSSIKIPDQN